VKVDYPDSLTTWRLTVRAVTAATDVGTTKAHVLTTKDLILRVVTPRFLTEGDQVNIPTVVHNYLPDTQAVNVSLSADGLTPAGTAAPGARPLSVASNGNERTDWIYTASAVRPVTITGKATSDTAGDAVEVTLPVRAAGLERTSSAAGSSLNAGERTMAVSIPSTANPAGRSVRVSLAPSLAGTMLGALDYLTSYPWGCTEQTLSSFVPNVVVLRALSDLKLAPTERMKSLDRQVTQGLERLYAFQHDDGGWGWWKTDENDPFMTAYAVDSLLQARDSGVRVNDWRIQNARRALIAMYAEYPRAIPDLKAYMVYVIARAGGEDTDAFRLGTAIDELWGARGRMTASGRAFLLLLLDSRQDARGATLANELMASAETRGDVSWWQVDTDPLLDDFGDTSVEASALALKALSSRDPGNPLLERVARWIVASRTNGYWFNTKQTALALDGLLAYMQARGERPAPVSVDVFVNGTRAGSTRFDAQSLVSPQPVLLDVAGVSGANTVRLLKHGEGALYYDASVRYYDKPAAEERTGSRKLAIVREYFSLVPIQRNGRIVYREQPFSGTAQAGELIRVRLTTAGATDWKYLILEDPIAAGTEQVEKEDLYEFERRPQWFGGSQRELRDDRTVFFLSDFVDGRYEFSYLLKVTTPGVFNAMPARIAPMYVQGVSASTTAATVSVPAGSVR
jgi:uncharacterized protein YfaS (alpha-2-macroglobulin family)